MLIIRHNPECERPIILDEMSAINDFVIGITKIATFNGV